MRVTILLGSGSSLPAGLPSTDELTRKVRTGDGIMRHTDGVYRFSQDPAPSEWNARVLLLTNALFSEIAAYYSDRPTHPVNYENCCYVTTQLHDAESGEFDNPALMPLVEKLMKKRDLRALIANKDDRLRLFVETDHYIRDVVWGMLSRRPSSVQYLGWLVDMVRDISVESTDVVTLNHDTVLEQAFSSNSVSFCDGFGEASNGVRYWEPDLLREPDRVRLLKLHGSIDWFFFRSNRKIGIPKDHDPFLTSPRPELLVGTFNKMLEYTTGIFADLHCHLHSSLRQTNFLVCCGYGFGDKGINTKLSEWINGTPERRLVVIHPNPCELFGCSRGAIANHWQSWQDQRRLLCVEKWVEHVTWNEVKRALTN